MLSILRWWWLLPLGILLGSPGTAVGADSTPQAAEDTPNPPPVKKKVSKRGHKKEPTRTRSGAPVSTPAPTKPRAEKARGDVRQATRATVSRPTVKAPAAETRVAFDKTRSERHRPAWQTHDPRYGHPAAHHVPAYPRAGHPPPPRHWYRPWYTHWWVHPYYRWVHVTHVVVWLDFTPDPWGVAWVPPARPGWVWVPGHYVGPVWIPGHWAPVSAAHAWYGVRWVFVPGWWMGTVYIDGYWRVAERSDGAWEWVEGSYQADGSYTPGYWRPAGPDPEGYTWEPGFWDGEQWTEGYWRPASREGYVWVRAHINADGTFEAGYWEPTEVREGMVWVPGWFDGQSWQSGYWVEQSTYEAADPDKWTPPAGVDEGWDETPAAPPTTTTEGEDIPLALPVG